MNLESSARRGDRGEICDGDFLGKIHRGQPLGPGDVIPRERMGPPLPSVPTLHRIIQLSGDQIWCQVSRQPGAPKKPSSDSRVPELVLSLSSVPLDTLFLALC